MVKRNRGKGKGRRKQGAMTRRAPEQKRARHADKASEADADDAAQDAAEDDEADAAAEDDEVGGADEPAEDGDADDASEPVRSEPDAAAQGAAWAQPLVKLDERWTWLEVRMMFVALITLTLVLCFWIAMRGMKEPVDTEAAAGTIWRALLGSAVLGGLVRLATRGRMPENTRNIVTAVAVVAGLVLAKSWRGVGIAYFEGLNDWLQEGSSLTLFAGLKGISTRLTMLVALMGASLASASGAHINIDVLLRLLPRQLLKPITLIGAVATAAVCFCTSWGTFDHIAITAYGAPPEATVGEKMGVVGNNLGEQFFLWRKQVGLDIGALPYVIQGKRWNDESRWKGKDWNAFLDEEGFVERYGAEAVATIRAPETAIEQPWQPFVVVPNGSARGMLQNGMDLLWPIGFLAIALRFLLRTLLLYAGQVRVQIEAEYAAEEKA